MTITISMLRSAAERSRPTRLAKSYSEARAKSQQTAFLCHSHKDDKLAQGLQVLLAENGWDVYIDWQDNTMPDKPDRNTAKKIQERIKQTDWFLFLATANSTASRWCPWEIGYADGTRPLDKILLIRTKDDSGSWYGNEYLQLYREITISQSGKWTAYPVGASDGGTVISSLR